MNIVVKEETNLANSNSNIKIKSNQLFKFKMNLFKHNQPMMNGLTIRMNATLNEKDDKIEIDKEEEMKNHDLIEINKRIEEVEEMTIIGRDKMKTSLEVDEMSILLDTANNKDTEAIMKMNVKTENTIVMTVRIAVIEDTEMKEEMSLTEEIDTEIADEENEANKTMISMAIEKEVMKKNYGDKSQPNMVSLTLIQTKRHISNKKQRKKR